MGRFYHGKTRYFLVFCVVEEILLVISFDVNIDEYHISKKILEKYQP